MTTQAGLLETHDAGCRGSFTRIQAFLVLCTCSLSDYPYHFLVLGTGAIAAQSSPERELRDGLTMEVGGPKP